MEVLDAIVDLLKGVSWPIAAIVIALAFKAEFRSMLPRLRRVGPTGAEFDAAEKQQTKSDQVQSTGELKELPGFPRTPAIENLERQLHTNLQYIDSDKRLDLLLRLLAQTRLEAAFERIYRLIFGIQIAILKRLNEKSSIIIDEASSIFLTYASQFQELQGYGFDSWLSFLVSNELIRKTTTSLEIADIGRDFLLYLVAKQLPEAKSF